VTSRLSGCPAGSRDDHSTKELRCACGRKLITILQQIARHRSAKSTKDPERKGGSVVITNDEEYRGSMPWNQMKANTTHDSAGMPEQRPE